MGRLGAVNLWALYRPMTVTLITLYPDLARQQLLHQSFFLRSEGGEFLSEQSYFGVAGL